MLEKGRIGCCAIKGCEKDLAVRIHNTSYVLRGLLFHAYFNYRTQYIFVNGIFNLS